MADGRALEIAGQTYLLFASALHGEWSIPLPLLDCVFSADSGLIAMLGQTTVIDWLRERGYVVVSDDALRLTESAREQLARNPPPSQARVIAETSGDAALCMLLDRLAREPDEVLAYRLFPLACVIADRAIAERSPLRFDLASLLGQALAVMQMAEAESYLRDAVTLYDADPRGDLSLILLDLLHLSALAAEQGDQEEAVAIAAKIGEVWMHHSTVAPVYLLEEWAGQGFPGYQPRRP